MTEKELTLTLLVLLFWCRLGRGLCLIGLGAAAAWAPYALADLPHPRPPTLEEKARWTEMIAIARVGPISYMRANPEDRWGRRMPWEFFDSPTPGAYPYVQLLDLRFLFIKPSVQKTIDDGHLDLDDVRAKPLWADLGKCIAYRYDGVPSAPTGEDRILFLWRMNPKSQGAFYVTTCSYSAEEPLSALPALQDILRSIHTKSH